VVLGEELTLFVLLFIPTGTKEEMIVTTSLLGSSLGTVKLKGGSVLLRIKFLPSKDMSELADASDV